MFKTFPVIKIAKLMREQNEARRRQLTTLDVGGAGGDAPELAQRAEWTEKLTTASDQYRAARGELATAQEDLANTQRTHDMLAEEVAALTESLQASHDEHTALCQEIDAQKAKLERAERQKQKMSKSLTEARGEDFARARERDIELRAAREANKAVIRALVDAGSKYPEMAEAVHSLLTEEGINIGAALASTSGGGVPGRRGSTALSSRGGAGGRRTGSGRVAESAASAPLSRASSAGTLPSILSQGTGPRSRTASSVGAGTVTRRSSASSGTSTISHKASSAVASPPTVVSLEFGGTATGASATAGGRSPRSSASSTTTTSSARSSKRGSRAGSRM